MNISVTFPYWLQKYTQQWYIMIINYFGTRHVEFRLLRFFRFVSPKKPKITRKAIHHFSKTWQNVKKVTSLLIPSFSLYQDRTVNPMLFLSFRLSHQFQTWPTNNSQVVINVINQSKGSEWRTGMYVLNYTR